jgi:polyhydroxyalkanoate synthesis regulator phasin
MSPKRIAALALSGALLAGGTGAAIAAVGKDEHAKSEQAILDDAAKRLDVTPQRLRDALEAAQAAELDKRLDAAVKAGKLTQKQADEIKQQTKKNGGVLGGKRFFGGPGGPRELHFRGGPLTGMRGAVALNLSKALGISREKLREQLRAGKSVADIAKAQGKSLADVRKTLKADAQAAADKAVKDGDLTRDQADKLLEHLDEMVEHIDKLPGMRMHERIHPGGPPDLEPGGFMPPPGEKPALEPGTFS